MDNEKYRSIFNKIENNILERATKKEILNNFKNPSEWDKSDNAIFTRLVHIIFYSGFKAVIVDQKIDIINYYFSDYKKVKNYNDSDIENITSDPKIIKNKSKINAIVSNSKIFNSIINQYGSFNKYLESYNAMESFENLILLKEDLEYLFKYLGGTTVYHFLTELGFPVLKPDRVVTRIFKRLGLIDNNKQLLKAIIQGRMFSKVAMKHIRYIDIIFVSFGQIGQNDAIGLEDAICSEKNPKCNLCPITEYCNYYKTIQKI